jgi:predicted RNase H-like nuclease
MDTETAGDGRADRDRYVGAHWAGDPWVTVTFGVDGLAGAAVHPSLGAVWAAHGERAERLLVDVSVGLHDEGRAERRCDALARAVLGDRAGAVVPPPVRPVVRKRRYPVAERTSERLTGRGLSERAFARTEPLAALDDLLGEVPEARAVVAESHPELCFRALAGAPLEHPRETAAGYAERLRTLAEFDPEAAPALQRAAAATGESDDGAARAVAVPDVLDALALGYAARPGPGRLRSLPPDPPTDPAGLAMALRYRATRPLEPDPGAGP